MPEVTHKETWCPKRIEQSQGLSETWGKRLSRAYLAQRWQTTPRKLRMVEEHLVGVGRKPPSGNENTPLNRKLTKKKKRV